MFVRLVLVSRDLYEPICLAGGICVLFSVMTCVSSSCLKQDDPPPIPAPPAANQENMHTYIHTYLHTGIHTYIHACMHAGIHTYIHTRIHRCIHIYIYIYIYSCAGYAAGDVRALVSILLNLCGLLNHLVLFCSCGCGHHILVFAHCSVPFVYFSLLRVLCQDAS